MNTAKNKTRALIALFLMLTVTVTSVFVALPSVNAHTPPWTVPTWCYVGATPDTIGVGQQVLIVFWINAIPPTASGEYGDRWTFYVDITKPDGTNETLGPYTSDPVGGSYCNYAPAEVGNYTVVARFPGQVITGLPLAPASLGQATVSINDTYAASSSDPVYFTVQQEPISTYQETPLPTAYWTRPVYGANRGWYVIMGQWLGGADNPGRINEYSTGPESAHIMWSRPYWDGGVMGASSIGYAGDYSYYNAISYDTPNGPGIILNGKVYYGIYMPPRYGWYCIDLYTGQTQYFHNTTGPVSDQSFAAGHSGGIYGESLAFGQVLDIENPNQHGGFAYLWSTNVPGKADTWRMFDAFTGNYICDIANVSSSGTAVNDNIGSICRFNIVNIGTTSNPKYYLTCWNTTQAIWWKGTQQMYQNGDYSGFSSNSYWLWRPYLNYTFDGSHGFSLNVSIPAVQGTIRSVTVDKYVIGGTTGSNNEQGVVQGNLWALNLDRSKGAEGTLLWNITFTPPSSAGNKTISMGTVDPENGVFLFTDKQLRQWYCYSLETGQLLWQSEPEAQFNFYGMSNSIYRGRLYSYGYSGEILAYNITTGHIDWRWSAPDEGYGETPYPNSPLSLGCIADGKLYMYSSEHSPTQPLRRDANIWCVDAETGDMLWKIQCWPTSGGSITSPIIADGYIIALDVFDNQIYCYGKGPSATTVSAPQTVPALGSSIMITGTVTDQSPSGRLKTDDTLDLALKGTPAISDADQEGWMEYLFHQASKPTNATGVPVSLDTIDPNGNFVHIGDATSDTSGNYGFKFTPEVPGTYQIIASFAGSKSYGPSSDTTYLSVDEPAASTPTATSPTASVADTYFVPAIAGLFVLIIVVAIVLALLMLRKRP
jgi:hypothetical protein